MVVTRAPFTVDSGVTHERTALPFTCTVHAPHCAMPQPNFVPVSLSSSRITHSRGVLSSERAETCLPLRLNETILRFLLWGEILALETLHAQPCRENLSRRSTGPPCTFAPAIRFMDACRRQRLVAFARFVFNRPVKAGP